MYIVIVGAGNLGYHLAKILLEEGHDVVVIDKQGDKCTEISNELNVMVIHGDATKPSVLEEAGSQEADAVVALTGSDETNLIIALLAKQMGAKLTAVRLGRVHYDEEVLSKLGIDLVIYPEAAAAGYISELLTKPHVLDLAFISRGDAEIMEVEVDEKSPLANKRVDEISLPEDAYIIGIYKDDNLRFPSKDLEIKPGDKVLIMVKTERANQVKDVLGI